MDDWDHRLADLNWRNIDFLTEVIPVVV